MFLQQSVPKCTNITETQDQNVKGWRLPIMNCTLAETINNLQYLSRLIKHHQGVSLYHAIIPSIFYLSVISTVLLPVRQMVRRDKVADVAELHVTALCNFRSNAVKTWQMMIWLSYGYWHALFWIWTGTFNHIHCLLWVVIIHLCYAIWLWSIIHASDLHVVKWQTLQ